MQSPSKMWQQHERLLRSTRGQPARCWSNGRQICNETHRWTLPTRSSGDRTRASFSRLPSTWHWRSRVTRPRLLGDGASAYLLHVQPLSNVNPSGAHFCQLLCFLSRQVWFQLPCGLWMSYEKTSPLHFASVFWKTTTIPKKKNCASWSGEVGCFK